MPATDRAGQVFAGGAFFLALGLIGFRIALALLDLTELSTDEAQYWFWGQTLEFGAYSKPPLIGWILRAATELLGQSVWAVRLPAVLFHAATAGVIFLAARRMAPRPVAELAALLYLVAPAVTLGSAVMTTDTPMLLAAAVALWAQLRAGEARLAGGRDRAAAVILGLALGLGILAKHAMLFWLAGGLAAAVLSPGLRPGRSDAALALAVMLVVVAPHVVWLRQHGFITLHHVEDITAGGGLSLLRPLRFLAEQFLVAGPILFPAMILGLVAGGAPAGVAALALVPLVIVVGQAAKGPALANWAVLYLVPGAILGALWLVRHRALARLALGLGLLVALALPMMKAFGTGVQRPDGRPVLSRYLGHGEIATWALETAREAGAQALVSQDRDLLADLSWFGATGGLAIRAVPPKGLPAHHWEMTAPYDPARDGCAVLLLRAGAALPVAEAAEIARLVAPPGFAGGQELVLYRLPGPACPAALQSPEP
ncbi:glycosyltransferase family 39 protein [Tabrizicola flagellatus]|uniref:glycosyltransferase family 39 protein n=1 Tax=Tabrizicola flagellatus TaxID=2593021 RepID=UPI00135B007F|nr:glycosyltransferase family 39 protein [Tabrizicola flagellatus]